MARKLKDKNAPKRPLSGFLLYGNYIRSHDEKIKNLPIKEQASTIGKLWNDLPENEKTKYNNQSAKLKEEYIKKKEEYEQTDEYKEFLESSKKSGQKKEKKKREGPTKISAYRVFVSENKDNPDDEKDPELAGKGHMAKCGIKWSRMNETQKKVYQDKAEKMNATNGVKAASESQEDDSN